MPATEPLLLFWAPHSPPPTIYSIPSPCGISLFHFHVVFYWSLSILLWMMIGCEKNGWQRGRVKGSHNLCQHQIAVESCYRLQIFHPKKCYRLQIFHPKKCYRLQIFHTKNVTGIKCCFVWIYCNPLFHNTLINDRIYTMLNVEFHTHSLPDKEGNKQWICVQQDQRWPSALLAPAGIKEFV